MSLSRKGLTVEGATFPFYIQTIGAVIAEFKTCEEGSYEDSRHVEHADDTDGPHVYTILERHRSKIEIRNEDEAFTVYLAACSGTLQLYRLQAAKRICNELRKFVPPERLKLWPAPTGE